MRKGREEGGKGGVGMYDVLNFILLYFMMNFYNSLYLIEGELSKTVNHHRLCPTLPHTLKYMK